MCYVEANKIMQYCYTQNSSFVSFKDVSDENIENAVEYMYHATIEQKLINYLMYGKYEKAEELLREIIKNNFDPTNSNFLQSKCLFFDIAATVFKVIQEKDGMGEFISINKGRLLANIDSYESNAQIQDEFLEIFKSICDSTIQNISNNTKRLSENILEFVKYNFSNPNISVAFISEQFNVSPNYVSMVFKKETGIPLSEYINSVRIEHAKDLLKNTHMKASEVAEKVGFSSVRTFSRVFNSLEGISPGEYRKQ